MMAMMVPAVTLSEAQAYVRIETGEEEALVTALVATATALCEQFTGRWLVEREYEVVIAASGEWQRLPLTPVRSIVAAARLAVDGSVASLASTDYSIDIDSSGDGWLRLKQIVGEGRIRVSGRAGMASGRNEVPEPLRQGILRLVAHLFTARDGVGGGVGGGGGGEPPAAVTALWRPYRRMQLA